INYFEVINRDGSVTFEKRLRFFANNLGAGGIFTQTEVVILPDDIIWILPVDIDDDLDEDVLLAQRDSQTNAYNFLTLQNNAGVFSLTITASSISTSSPTALNKIASKGGPQTKSEDNENERKSSQSTIFKIITPEAGTPEKLIPELLKLKNLILESKAKLTSYATALKSPSMPVTVQNTGMYLESLLAELDKLITNNKLVTFQSKSLAGVTQNSGMSTVRIALSDFFLTNPTITNPHFKTPDEKKLYLMYVLVHELIHVLSPMRGGSTSEARAHEFTIQIFDAIKNNISDPLVTGNINFLNMLYNKSIVATLEVNNVFTKIALAKAKDFCTSGGTTLQSVITTVQGYISGLNLAVNEEFGNLIIICPTITDPNYYVDKIVTEVTYSGVTQQITNPKQFKFPK
ncbi:MAG: hypothetical protein HY606_14310, partial [Planctomycetes bacterium]|nr:hypothetical protein [Planctomycetota bacterium]